MGDRMWHKVVSVALTLLAQALLWVYIQKGLMTSLFDGAALFDPSAGTIALCLLVVAAAIALSRPSRIREALESDACVAILGVLGAIGVLASRFWFPLASDALGVALCYLALVAEALSFSAVFLAWARRLCGQIYGWGLGKVFAVQVAAILLSLLLVPIHMNGTAYVAAIGVSVFPVASMCLIAVRHLEAIPDTPSGDGGAKKTDKRVTVLLASIALLFAAVGVLSYLPYFGPGKPQSYEEDPATFALTVVPLVLLVLVASLSERFAMRPRALAMFAVVAALLVVFVLFSLAFAIATDSDLQFGLARLARRISRSMAFFTVLMVVYRFDIDPEMPVALAFVAPAILPKAVLATVEIADPAAGISNASGAYAVLMVAGFVITVMLVFLCIANIDGRLMGTLLGAESAGILSSVSVDTGASASSELVGACRALGKEYGLTQREMDVVRLFFQGMTAREAAHALSISVGTVNTHSGSAYRKLDIHSRAELIERVERARGL